MNHYNIITDEGKLDEFITTLPETTEQEVYYICLFGRHKYCPEFPNTKDAGQLARITARKSDIKEKIRRLETPIGSYTRNGTPAPQEAIALYMGLNPRNLIKANKQLLMELASRCAEGNLNFNPITLATTEIHRATDRKFFVDFDYDTKERLDDYLTTFKQTLPVGSYRVLQTRGGFHLIVELEKVKINPAYAKTNWYKTLTALPFCDVKGANNLTPVAGCIQGGFTPHFLPLN